MYHLLKVGIKIQGLSHQDVKFGKSPDILEIDLLSSEYQHLNPEKQNPSWKEQRVGTANRVD